jgi:apolipoprotein N-acyltransferase
LSQLEAERPIQAVVWPEAAVPFDYKDYPEVQKNLSHAAPGAGYIFLGHIRKDKDFVFNSFSVLSDTGKIMAVYDKKHLVPFGEFVPFKAFLPGIEKLTHGSKDFSRGVQSSIINLPGIPPFRPLICYEVLFPEEICPKENGTRPQWILNITNDGWYGNTTGPHQHLHIARTRAIEQGLPLVRVANNGISAVFDGRGRLLHSLSMNDVGIIDFALPAPENPTFFYLYGGFIKIFLFILSGMILGALLWKNRREILTRK